LGEARERAPEDEEVILAFALATAEAGDVDGAAAALEELASARPDFAHGFYVLGQILMEAGDYAAGRHYFFEYLKRADEGLAPGYAREGIKASARAEMEAAARALEKGPRREKEETKPAREAGPALSE